MKKTSCFDLTKYLTEGVWVLTKNRNSRSFKWLCKKVSDIKNLELRGFLEKYRGILCSYIIEKINCNWSVDDIVSGIFEILQNQISNYPVYYKLDKEIEEEIKELQNEKEYRERKRLIQLNLKRNISGITVNHFVVLKRKKYFSFYIVKNGIIKDICYSYSTRAFYNRLKKFIPKSFHEIMCNTFVYKGKSDPVKELESFGFNFIMTESKFKKFSSNYSLYKPHN